MEPGVSYSTNPTPEPTLPPIQPKNPHSQPTVFILAILLAIVLVTLGGIYLFKAFKKPVATTEQANTSVSPTSGTYYPQATTPMPQLSNWKEYVDPTNVFSIKYPQEYSLKNYSESSFNGIELDFIKPATSASASAQLTLKIIYLQNSAKNALQFAQDQVKLEKNATLNDKTISLKGEWGRGKIIFMEKNGTVFRLSSVVAAPLNFIPGYESTIDQIFSTFTILNPDDRGK